MGSEISSKDTIKTNRQNTKGMRVISKSNNESEFTSACLLPDGHVIGATESSVRKNNIVWKAKSNEKARGLSFVRNGKYVVFERENFNVIPHFQRHFVVRSIRTTNNSLYLFKISHSQYTHSQHNHSQHKHSQHNHSNKNALEHRYHRSIEMT